MSAPTASKSKKNAVVEVEPSRLSKIRTAAKGWVPSFIVSFAAVFIASGIEYFVPIPVLLSTTLIALPVLLSAVLIKKSVWKIAARSAAVAVFVNFVYSEYSIAVFVIGSAWVLRRAWVDGNPGGENYRLIKLHRRIKGAVMSKLSFPKFSLGHTKVS